MSAIEAQPGDWVRILAGNYARRPGRIIAVGLNSIRISVKVGPFDHVEVRLAPGQFRVLSKSASGDWN